LPNQFDYSALHGHPLTIDAAIELLIADDGIGRPAWITAPAPKAAL